MTKKTKWLVAAGATLVAATTLVACSNSSSSTSSSKDINWAVPTEILTLDISKNTDHYSALAIGNSGSNIYRLGKNSKLELDLAKKVDVSDDGKTYTITLRDNLKWSDGSKLTAKDFVYSWQRIVNPETASEYAYLVSEAHVVNATEINSGQITDLNQLGVKAESDTKLVFTLTSPSPQFKYFLAFANFMPQKESAVKEYGKNYATASKYQVYSGPYTVTGWNGSNGTFKLKKNKYYWDAKNVKTDTVNVQTVKKPDTAVQMYKRGELDNASATSAIYNANKNNKDVVDVFEATTSYMSYNMSGSTKGLDNKKIRQALNLATDRDAVVKAAVDTGSTAATAFVPYKLETLTNGKDLTDYVAPGYKYDVKEAAKLFKEGLAEAGLTSLKLTITADADSPAAKNLVDYIKSTWESNLPGLTIEEKFVTFKQRLEDTKNQNFDVAVVLWGGDYPEGSTFYGLFQSTAAYNYGKFNSEAYDAVYTKAVTTDATDQEAGAKDYKEAEKILFDEAAYNPLYFRNTKALRNPKLTGLVENTTGLNTDFTHAYKK